MRFRTILTLLIMVVALGLVLVGNKTLAAIAIVALLLFYILSKYRPFALKDIPLTELNERYAIPRQPDSECMPVQRHYRSRYINVRCRQPSNGAAGASEHETLRYPMIHYCDNIGSGPIVLALHGVMDSAHAWEGWISEIGELYRLVALDLPGFGLTGPLLAGHYTMESYVQFVDDFAASLNIRRFHLVGNSLGGAIAWNYAIDHADKVDKLILIDPAGFPQKLPGILRFVTLPVIEWVIPVLTPRFVFSRSVKQVYGDTEKATEKIIDRFFEIALRPGNRSAAVRIFKEMAKQAGSHRLADRIPRIEQLGLGTRTMLMWGGRDQWVPLEHMELWRNSVPSLTRDRCKIYEGIGHVPHEELPCKTARDAHQFLSSEEPTSLGAQLHEFDTIARLSSMQPLATTSRS